jgi:large subunit ribosomal protein L2
MKIIKLNPTTNGSRHQLSIKKSLLSKNNRLLRNSIKGISYAYGKSSLTGHTAAWHLGGGAKNIFRKVEFSNTGYNSIVVANLYDPCRSAFISLNFDLENLSFFRVLSVDTIFPGTLTSCNIGIEDLKLGYRTQIKNIPTGSIVNNLTVNSKALGQYIRSAGAYGQIIQTDHFKAKVRLPSNVIIEVSTDAFASIGVLSNIKHSSVCLGKAGRNRFLGRRPTVRGVAMNPVDHPHGGRTNGGRPSVTPWGLPTKSGFYLKKRNKRNA